MGIKIRIALIGNYDATVPAHRAIPIALELAATSVAAEINPVWVPTEEIVNTSRVAGFDGLWCVPASPYRSMEGALLAIKYAREQKLPFLGTCGGFQHTIIEYARNVLGWDDADHAETAPNGLRLVISPLACELVETSSLVRFRSGSRIAVAYEREEAVESYRCRFGLNPAFQERLLSGGLRVSAYDSKSEVRAVELDNHPFFVATLFQPERIALVHQLPPLIAAFVQATYQISSDYKVIGR
ncbi:CTP synthase [Scytonema sp. NUACC21]